MTTTEKKKSILVTGGNTGIGFALCKQLLLEDNCKVYLGARNVERGRKAVEDIQKMCSDSAKAKDIRFVLIDVSDDTSVQEAATTMKSMLATSTGTASSSSLLYGLVNNANVALQTGSARTGCEDEVLATNLYGPKRVADAFLHLIETQGRIVNVSSGAASIYLRDQSSRVKKFFTNPQTTWEELVWKVERRKTLIDGGERGDACCVYGLSKAAVNLLTIQQSKMYRRPKKSLICASICPGFMATTNMTAGWNSSNAKLVTPREGTVSIRTCLFSSDIVSGYHYGRDGLRSPLSMTRDPGTPEYDGEDEETIDRNNNNKHNSMILNELGDYSNRAYRMDKKAFGKLHKSNHNKQIGYNNIKSSPTSKKVRFWFDNDWRCTSTEVV
mmetsp:Transcript_32422/g.37267  ORF Transcript_32422/g.37267 Transcript_32422/m.37267 type:complete len:385 (-) Transcript_32422:51-1205(-)